MTVFILKSPINNSRIHPPHYYVSKRATQKSEWGNSATVLSEKSSPKSVPQVFSSCTFFSKTTHKFAVYIFQFPTLKLYGNQIWCHIIKCRPETGASESAWAFSGVWYIFDEIAAFFVIFVDKKLIMLRNEKRPTRIQIDLHFPFNFAIDMSVPFNKIWRWEID